MKARPFGAAVRARPCVTSPPARRARTHSGRGRPGKRPRTVSVLVNGISLGWEDRAVKPLPSPRCLLVRQPASPFSEPAPGCALEWRICASRVPLAPDGSRAPSRRSARNYHMRTGRSGDAGLPGKWSSGSGSRRDLGTPCRVGLAQSGASASPTETPQLSDTAADPHRNPTDETAHSGTLVMGVKGTENSRSAASMRVSWAVGVFPGKCSQDDRAPEKRKGDSSILSLTTHLTSGNVLSVTMWMRIVTLVVSF